MNDEIIDIVQTLGCERCRNYIICKYPDMYKRFILAVEHELKFNDTIRLAAEEAFPVVELCIKCKALSPK
jgi:hypothetical protein